MLSATLDLLPKLKYVFHAYVDCNRERHIEKLPVAYANKSTIVVVVGNAIKQIRTSGVYSSYDEFCDRCCHVDEIYIADVSKETIETLKRRWRLDTLKNEHALYFKRIQSFREYIKGYELQIVSLVRTINRLGEEIKALESKINEEE